MRGLPTARRFDRPAIAGMRRVCFVRFELSGDDVSATAVGVGHRLPAECAVSLSQGLELAEHYPVVVHRSPVGSTQGAA